MNEKLLTLLYLSLLNNKARTNKPIYTIKLEKKIKYMSETINGKIVKSNQQKMEELYCWAELAGNGKNLAKPVIVNESAFNKVQVEITNLRKKLFGK